MLSLCSQDTQKLCQYHSLFQSLIWRKLSTGAVSVQLSFHPDTPFFFFWCSGISSAFINISFSVPQETSVSGTFASLPRANTVMGESFWLPASSTSFVTVLPPTAPSASPSLTSSSLYISEEGDLSSQLLQLYFLCLFLRWGHLFHIEGVA